METVAVCAAEGTPRLLMMAVRGIESMVEPGRRLFCYRLRKAPDGLMREGISHRYTAMTLLGLLRARPMGLTSQIDIDSVVDQLLKESAWVDNVGDLGLLLSLCASCGQDRMDQFDLTFDVSGALKRYPDTRRALTMELSWFLTGLVFSHKAGSREHTRLAYETYDLIRRNQGESGLFGHMAKSGSMAGMVRGHVGSFADQVYPIFAFAHFSQIFGHKQARENALCCANAICDLQGPMGQWWWHYNSVTGRVVEQYPVYSVHQHGMAPMALLALQETCGADYYAPINKGLKWINGANELGQDLEDRQAGVAWRCIQPSKSSKWLTAASTYLGLKTSRGPLYPLYECRPYELGWLLYALAPTCHAANLELN